MSQYQFEPVTISVPVTLTSIEIGPYPTVVRSIWGRGNWPYHNIVFEFSDLSIYQLIDVKLRTAYNSLGAELAIRRWFGDPISEELLSAERAQGHRAVVRRWLLDWWYRPKPRRL
jgi:hypothetical protein